MGACTQISSLHKWPGRVANVSTTLIPQDKTWTFLGKRLSAGMYINLLSSSNILLVIQFIRSVTTTWVSLREGDARQISFKESGS